MNRSRAAISFISALGFVLGLVPSSPLYAQTQSQPQATACPLEGPSITDTLKYINAALAASEGLEFGNNHHENASLEFRQDELINRFDSVLYAQRTGERILTTHFEDSFPVYLLDCKVAVNPNNPNVIAVSCATTINCGTGRNYTDDGAANGGPNNYFNVWYRGDIDHGERLARALSHLVALLKQQYKQSHSDPNDPFAKPQ
jgi:hypothetical protein